MNEYELWQDWSKIDKPDTLVCTTNSEQDAEEIQIALEKIKGLHNYYIKSN